MKTSFTVGKLRGATCVRLKATIGKSKKMGIPRRYEKTWSTLTVAPNFTLEEMKSSYEAEARRWEQKIMLQIGQAKLPPPMKLTEGEMFNGNFNRRLHPTASANAETPANAGVSPPAS